jgi:hypothetical protein
MTKIYEWNVCCVCDEILTDDEVESHPHKASFMGCSDFESCKTKAEVQAVMDRWDKNQKHKISDKDFFNFLNAMSNIGCRSNN